MEKISFTYDPIALTRQLTQIYIENNYNSTTGDLSGARLEALYDFCLTMTNEELEELVDKYRKEEDVDTITFKEESGDQKGIVAQMLKSERYAERVIQLQIRGADGHGVYDKTYHTFHSCDFGLHFSTVLTTIKENHPEKHEAVREFLSNEGLEEWGEFTREELDEFITNNFTLVTSQSGSQPRLL